jgi:integrase/recombinase XerD
MSATTLVELCRRARPELACLGELGGPLLAVVGVIERVGATRGVDALADPGFALDVLTATNGEGDAATVGRVLEFLRLRTDAAPVGAVAASTVVTITEAVELYEAGALALMAEGTLHTYRTWTRRLVADHGDRDPSAVTAGDLTDLIAKHVLAARRGDERRRGGRSAEENAVGAFRHLWGYLVEKGYTPANVALRLRKPTRAEPRRRAVTVEESALLRELARRGRDPLLDEVTITIPERLGLRRIELCRLRLCDLDLERGAIEVWGKGDKYRTLPLPPQLAALLTRYVEDRRPPKVPIGQWQRSTESLLRRPPDAEAPLGTAVGRRRIEDMFDRFHRNAPDLFAHGDVSLHSYRHALGTFIDARYGRPVTRAVLGHTSRRSPTDHYVHVPTEHIAEVLTAYEMHLLGDTAQSESTAGELRHVG